MGNVHGVVGQKVTIPPGTTQAVFIPQLAGVQATLVKYSSGGTLEILGASLGSTIAISDLNSLSGTGYLVSSTEAATIDGPAAFYLAATGATTIAYLLRGKSAGT